MALQRLCKYDVWLCLFDPGLCTCEKQFRWLRLSRRQASHIYLHRRCSNIQGRWCGTVCLPQLRFQEMRRHDTPPGVGQYVAQCCPPLSSPHAPQSCHFELGLVCGPQHHHGLCWAWDGTGDAAIYSRDDVLTTSRNPYWSQHWDIAASSNLMFFWE